MIEDVKKIVYRNIKGVTRISEVNVGASIASVYKIDTFSNSNYYLKVQEKSIHYKSLSNEEKAIKWINNRLVTPRMKFYYESEKHEYLCLTEVVGCNFDIAKTHLSIEDAIGLYARSLKALHMLPVENCYVRNDLDNKLYQAKISIQKDLVDHNDLEEEYKIYTPQELYDHMTTMVPKDQEYVFTHGDYCFDNLIYTPEKKLGYIDISNGGIADRYQDIALAVRSIKHEFGEKYLDLFYKSYGIDKVDEKKIEFYILLDEFS